MRIVIWAAVALFAGPMPAQAQSEWRALGEMLGGMLGGDTGRVAEQRAYDQNMSDQLVQAEYESARYAAQSERLMLERNEAMRNTLVDCWSVWGFSDSQAREIARNYEGTAAEAAVISTARRKGAAAMPGDIGAALDSYNYLLANQLMIAYVLVATEELAAARPAEIDATVP